MKLKDLTSSLKQSAQSYKDSKDEKAQLELARQNEIASGRIEPIETAIKLLEGEKAYIVLPARKMANIETTVSHTTGKTKKKHGISRAIVGGVLLGPIGAGVGAVTAGGKTNSKTTHQKITQLGVVDNGSLILTDQRAIFIGNEVNSITYKQMLTLDLAGKPNYRKLEMKYEGMAPGEHYIVNGHLSKDLPFYLKGIKQLRSLEVQERKALEN
jgi:hypothetical protein